MIYRLLLASTVSLVALHSVADAQDAVGVWKMTQEFRGQTRDITITIKQGDDGLTGTWTAPRGESELSDVKLDDGTLTFTRSFTRQNGQTMEIDVEAKVVDGKLVGKISTPRGERDFTATRAAADVSFVGTWDVTFEMRGREIEAQLAITESNDKSLAGTWTGQRGEGQLDNVKIEDKTLTFSRDLEFQGQSFTLDYSAKIEDGKLQGVIESPMGEIDFAGVKVEQEEDSNEDGGRGAQLMQRFDADGDGKLSEDEAPERMQQFFTQIDSNGDGYVDGEELEAMMEFVRSRRGNQ